jgi:hypothetical protein
MACRWCHGQLTSPRSITDASVSPLATSTSPAPPATRVLAAPPASTAGRPLSRHARSGRPTIRLITARASVPQRLRQLCADPSGPTDPSGPPGHPAPVRRPVGPRRDPAAAGYLAPPVPPASTAAATPEPSPCAPKQTRVSLLCYRISPSRLIQSRLRYDFHATLDFRDKCVECRSNAGRIASFMPGSKRSRPDGIQTDATESAGVDGCASRAVSSSQGRGLCRPGLCRRQSLSPAGAIDPTCEYLSGYRW